MLQIYKNIFKKINKSNIKLGLYYLRKGKIKEIFQGLATPVSTTKNKSTANYVDLCEWLEQNTVLEPDFIYFKETIDIILPIYNGFEYFDKLFKTIIKTNLRYRLFIVNDCSTDERVNKYLKTFITNNSHVTLISNDKNLGFVKSVNKALALTTNHVALINSDIELPSFWLERLMNPIISNSKIASSTPFTNSGTICSFPNIGEDNELFENLSVTQIDFGFQKIKPSYTEVPTGVGFCMGMNKNTLKKIGRFDEKTFLKGYGEENDWCQRAIKAGYKNVVVENLFVYHKHGGSFFSDEKKKLISRNSQLLNKKHANYNTDVAIFFQNDPLKNFRQFVVIYLFSSLKTKKQMLAFDHTQGGGATLYLESKVNQMLLSMQSAVIVRYEPVFNCYSLNYQSRNYKINYKFKDFFKLEKILEHFPVQEIYVNELVTYPNLDTTLKYIIELKEKFVNKVYMLLHDYFSICPSVQLLNVVNSYCYLPANKETCNNCFKKKSNSKEFSNIEAWRASWELFLSQSDEIIAFSNYSKQIFGNIYPKIKNISIIPHVVNYITKVEKNHKTTTTINIGLLGLLGHHKGVYIIKEMLSLIAKKDIRVKIILLGSSEGYALKHKNYFETGKYTKESLPLLTLKNDIDIFFISSTWPETFSYTCEEAIKMNIPVASFNIGAQAERIAVYEKGLIISEMNAEAALEQILSYIKNKLVPYRPIEYSHS